MTLEGDKSVKKKRVAFGVGLLLALLIPSHQIMAADVTLHIPPIFQERPSWCWAAVGEMVFKYYYIPVVHRTDYQCGIAQGRKLCDGMTNCLECDLPAVDEATMMNVLEQYPAMVTLDGAAGDIALTAQSKSGSLSEAEVKQEIDEGRPIIVGLSPSGFKVDDVSQHMALIVGYDERDGELMLTVNDPFPFEDDRFLWIGNPYQKMDAPGGSDGQYEIRFQRLLSKLKWNQTIYRVTCTGRDCPPEKNHIADGSLVKDDREVIQTVLTASSQNFANLRKGHKAVDAEAHTTWLSTMTFSGAKHCLVRDKDVQGGARWSCLFRYADRSDADIAVEDIVKRLRNNLPNGWVGTDLDADTDAGLYTKTDKFSANKPGNTSAVRVYLFDTKKDGRVKVFLSVDNN